MIHGARAFANVAVPTSTALAPAIIMATASSPLLIPPTPTIAVCG